MLADNNDFRSRLEASDGNFPSSWRPEPGDYLLGTLERYTSGQTEYGHSHVAIVRDEDSGELISVWLFYKVLINEFKREKPKPGERIGIRRLEDSESGGYRRYVVMVDREETEIPDFETPSNNSEGTALEDEIPF